MAKRNWGRSVGEQKQQSSTSSRWNEHLGESSYIHLHVECQMDNARLKMRKKTGWLFALEVGVVLASPTRNSQKEAVNRS